MITKEQYEHAVRILNMYNANKHIKLYMDDSERESYKKALETIEEYQKQFKNNKIEENQQKTK